MHGGLALVVDTDGTVSDVRLPEPPRRGRLTNQLQIYFAAYETRLVDATGWTTALDDVTRWLWHVRDALLAARPETKRATLVPVGALGFLPLHAAWTDTDETPTRRRYALDAVTLTYAPNASIAAAVEERASGRPRNGCSRSKIRGLYPRHRFRARETRSRGQRRSSEHQHLCQEQLSDTSSSARRTTTPMLHIFACHGAMNPDDPTR